MSVGRATRRTARWRDVLYDTFAPLYVTRLLWAHWPSISGISGIRHICSLPRLELSTIDPSRTVTLRYWLSATPFSLGGSSAGQNCLFLRLALLVGWRRSMQGRVMHDLCIDKGPVGGIRDSLRS